MKKLLIDESYDNFKSNMYAKGYLYDDADVYDMDGDFYQTAWHIFVMMNANGIEEISKIKEYLDDEDNLRYKWIIMFFYQNPENANWPKARDKFIYDIMRSCVYDTSEEISD